MYQVKRLNAGVAANTVQGETVVLRKVLRWAKRTKKISELPEISGVGVEVDETEPLTREEVERILRHLLPRVRPLVRFVAELRCRKSEAFGLTWEHVSLEEGWVLFKSTRRRQLKTKQSMRRVYLGDGLRDQLTILKLLVKPDVGPAEQQYVFPGRKPEQPLDNVRKALKAAVEKANVRRDGELMNVSVKSFRNAYASWLANGNQPDVVIQSNLGHAQGSRVTRKHYERAYDVARRQAIIQLDVPLTVAKSGGRWQSAPKTWQSLAMPNKSANLPEGDKLESPIT